MRACAILQRSIQGQFTQSEPAPNLVHGAIGTGSNGRGTRRQERYLAGGDGELPLLLCGASPAKRDDAAYPMDSGGERARRGSYGGSILGIVAGIDLLAIDEHLDTGDVRPDTPE